MFSYSFSSGNQPCMTVELLNVWQRNSLSSTNDAKIKLDNLMNFLLSEVEGEQQYQEEQEQYYHGVITRSYGKKTMKM